MPNPNTSGATSGPCWWSTVECSTPPVAHSSRGSLHWPLSSRQKAQQRAMEEQRHRLRGSYRLHMQSKATSTPEEVLPQHAPIRPRDYLPRDRLRTPQWFSQMDVNGMKRDRRTSLLEYLVLSPRGSLSLPLQRHAQSFNSQLPPLLLSPRPREWEPWSRAQGATVVSMTPVASQPLRSERWRPTLPPQSSPLWKTFVPPGGRHFHMGQV